MDSPIYIYFAYRVNDEKNPENFPGVQNQLIVFDDSDAAGGSMVRISNLPELGIYSYLCFDFAVASSRLFLVSVFDPRHTELNGIFSVNIDGSSPRWNRNPLSGGADEFWAAGGTAVAGDRDLIYGSTRDLFAFNPNTETFEFIMSITYLLGVNGTKIYANCISGSSVDSSVLGYYDIESLTWKTIDPIAKLYGLENKVFVFRESYLIDFSLAHPMTGVFKPAVYVYDICKREWLSDPVEGLLNDDHALPDDFDTIDVLPPISYPSLVEVSRDEQPRLALVWLCDLKDGRNVLHLSKFTLAIDEDANGSPTFRAKDVSSFELCSVDAIVVRVSTMAVY